MSADHETMHDKSSIKFQVIISDRRVDDHGYRKDEVDSTHSILSGGNITQVTGRIDWSSGLREMYGPD
jgi:hypothetical protein